MSLPDFAKLNERRAEAGLSTFMNPRNSAAGTIRQLDPKLAADRPLSFWAYAIGATEGISFESHWDALEWLREHRFPVHPGRQEAEDRGRGRRAVPRVGAAPGVARLRDRRRRRQGQPTSSCSAGWASSAASRAGRSPGSSRRRRR